jgi:hypothetical protein
MTSREIATEFRRSATELDRQAKQLREAARSLDPRGRRKQRRKPKPAERQPVTERDVIEVLRNGTASITQILADLERTEDREAYDEVRVILARMSTRGEASKFSDGYYSLAEVEA